MAAGDRMQQLHTVQVTVSGAIATPATLAGHEALIGCGFSVVLQIYLKELLMLHKREPIELLSRRYDYFPASFRWRGRRFQVMAVRKCWTTQTPVPRRRFRVRCVEGIFELEHDLRADIWRVGRRPATLWLRRKRRSIHSPRYPLPRNRRRPQAQQGWLARLGGRLAIPARTRAAATVSRRSSPWKPTPQRP